MRNWDLREFRVRVNLPFLIRQVLLLIRWVKTAIQGLLNPIRQVLPLTSHIGSYPPYRSHLHPHLSFSTIIAEPKVKSSLSISPCHNHESTLSTAYTEYRIQPSTPYTEYSIHRVQHTPSTAYTENCIHRVEHTPSTASTHDCLSSLHSHNYELTPECSFSFRRASLQARPPPACSP
jgi:hypothetical protein